MYKKGDLVKIVDDDIFKKLKISSSNDQIYEIESIIDCQGLYRSECEICCKQRVRLKDNVKINFCAYRFKKINREKKLQRILK